MYASAPPAPTGFRIPDNGTGPSSGGGDGHDHLPSNWSSLIGIITAIVGNVLIALALNVQRYAHIRLHRQRAYFRERARQALKKAANGHNGGGYGTLDARAGSPSRDAGRRRRADEAHADDDDTEPLVGGFPGGGGDPRWAGDGAEDDRERDVASTYLKSPYWWLGQVLITVGEMGNFLAYGFAPASIVSPLGVVALVSNCVIAPILFKEVFRARDFWGVVVAMAGAVTVVLSAKGEETKLNPHDVWDAITTLEFEVYLAVTCGLIVLLMWASPRYGNRTILIDLGLVGLYGGYTVLATKGVSSMLSSTLLGAFKTPVTYVLMVILLATAVMQVRYVNKALQRFDSTQVIPIQFVMFTLCVIVGSAVLYRDFERTSAEQALKFVGGCLLTFFGVFLITSGRRSGDEDDEQLSDAEGVEETIGLAEQGGAAGPPQSILQTGDEASRSRRSSRASRVSFRDTLNKPLAVLADTGIPSKRAPGAPGFKTAADGDDAAVSLGSPWRHSLGTSPPSHPGMAPHTHSTDSIAVVSVTSSAGAGAAGTSEPASVPTTPLSHHAPAFLTGAGHAPEPPATPRHSTSSASSRPHAPHFSNHQFISPSPLGSTVSAVVSDHLRKQLDAAGSPLLLPRRLHARRSRPSLRSSLFVPHDELLLDDDDDGDDEHGRLLGQSRTHDETESGPWTAAAGHDESAAAAAAAAQTRRGFRGRARSFSNTLGELLGGRRRRRRSGLESEEEEDGRAEAQPRE